MGGWGWGGVNINASDKITLQNNTAELKPEILSSSAVILEIIGKPSASIDENRFVGHLHLCFSKL